jgi:hypothetical protein
VNTESLPDEAEPAASAEPELRGPVLDVLRTLLGVTTRDGTLTGRIRLVDLPSLLPSRWVAQRAASAAAAAQGSRMPIHFRRTHV